MMGLILLSSGMATAWGSVRLTRWASSPYSGLGFVGILRPFQVTAVRAAIVYLWVQQDGITSTPINTANLKMAETLAA
jgi:hypothetical protein